jgi:hypothetical protein
MDQSAPPSFTERFTSARLTKMGTVWCCVATAIVTMVIGFTWGQWVTGSTARAMAATQGEETIVKRLTPICVAQFKVDPKKDEKLRAMKALDSWQQTDYVKTQGWATMPGEQDPETRVATECAKLASNLGAK